MKKVISLVLVFMFCFSLCACDGKNKKAYELSKQAYENISIAYEITDQYGTDIYEAWMMAIYDADEVMSDGVDYLVTELSLSADELREAVVYTMVDIIGENWETTSDAQKEALKDRADEVFAVVEDDLFTFCVSVVTNAYKLNGKAEEAENALEEAKAQMKELSVDYSDYEHYPNLKEYYTTTSSFFDFCNNPTGSFEQIKETLNDYKNDARDYISDLDYIFEE